MKSMCLLPTAFCLLPTAYYGGRWGRTSPSPHIPPTTYHIRVGMAALRDAPSFDP
jgi:hypothetical protein